MDPGLKKELGKYRFNAYKVFTKEIWKPKKVVTYVLNHRQEISDYFETLLVDILEMGNNQGVPVPVSNWTVGTSRGILTVTTSYHDITNERKFVDLQGRRYIRYTGGPDPFWPVQLNEKNICFLSKQSWWPRLIRAYGLTLLAQTSPESFQIVKNLFVENDCLLFREFQFSVEDYGINVESQLCYYNRTSTGHKSGWSDQDSQSRKSESWIFDYPVVEEFVEDMFIFYNHFDVLSSYWPSNVAAKFGTLWKP
jgi:hypothetical protein